MGWTWVGIRYVVVLRGVQGMIGDPKGAPKFGNPKLVLEDLKSDAIFNGDFFSVGTCLATVGLNEKQWKENMKIEHCDIDPGDPKSTTWGASDRQWTTGNYGRKKQH